MKAYQTSKEYSPPDNRESAGDITTIKVFKDSGIDEIDPKSLKQYISKNRDIKKVVIEKISLEEASRISLLFEPDEDKKKTKIARTCYLENEDPIDISLLEQEVNLSFFNGDLGTKSKTVAASGVRANLSMKRPAASLSGLKDDLTSYSQETSRKLSYEKHSLTRQNSQKSASSYYRVKDHMELFKVGSSYLKDYQAGISSMGFSSYNLPAEGKKTVFGISSFFNYHDSINVCIITNDLNSSFYASMFEEFEMRKDLFLGEDVEYDIFHADGNDFIEFSEITNVKHSSNHSGPGEFIEFLLDKYDLILWDLPALEYMNKNREIFFPIVCAIESLTLIVGAEISKGKELEALISYYQKYQVPIKGILFSDTAKVRKKKEVQDGLA